MIWLSTVQGTHDDLVDEKGGLEDFHRFAQAADIVVCCLAMNSETVKHLAYYALPIHLCRKECLVF